MIFQITVMIWSLTFVISL